MLYDDPLRYWPRFAAALGIITGGAGGWLAALDRGDLWRFGGTFVFLTITLSLYVWKFHMSKL